MDSIQSIFSTVRRITRPIILRRLEMVFYIIFIALCFISFVIPLALDVSRATFYIVGVLSLIYAIGLYFFRFKIKVTYGLVLHTAAFFLFLSFIIFDFGLYEIAGTFLFLAAVIVSIIITLCGLGHRVSAYGGNEPPVNQAWPEVENQANVDGPGEDQINVNHWHFNGDVNAPEMPNDVNPEVLNDDIADPQVQQNDNINPEVQNN